MFGGIRLLLSLQQIILLPAHIYMLPFSSLDKLTGAALLDIHPSHTRNRVMGHDGHTSGTKHMGQGRDNQN